MSTTFQQPMPGRSAQASLVIRHHVGGGHSEAYEAWVREITARAAHYPGHLEVQVMRPPAGGHEYVAVVRFASRDDRRAGRLSDKSLERLTAQVMRLPPSCLGVFPALPQASPWDRRQPAGRWYPDGPPASSSPRLRRDSVRH